MAVAYINVDGQDGYDPDADVLIAQFEDVDNSGDPSVGDVIRTNRYPRLLNASEFGTLGDVERDQANVPSSRSSMSYTHVILIWLAIAASLVEAAELIDRATGVA